MNWLNYLEGIGTGIGFSLACGFTGAYVAKRRLDKMMRTAMLALEQHDGPLKPGGGGSTIAVHVEKLHVPAGGDRDVAHGDDERERGPESPFTS